MPSIHDVAKRAQVSTATVSRSFRTPELLSEETLARVAEAARELNYQPRASRAGNTGFEVIPSIGNDAIGFQFFFNTDVEKAQLNAFYAPMLMGAQQEAASSGFNTLIHTADSHSLSKEMPRMVSQRSIDGMLLVGSCNSADLLPAFAEYIPHIVLLDGCDPARQFECVISDGFSGMYEATRYLLELGHRKIGFFLTEAEMRIYQDRMHGYICALIDAGIVPDPKLIIGNSASATFETRETRLTNMLVSPNRPTALLVANDDYAMYVMGILRRMGLQAPQDISIIGFDNANLSLHSNPPLTSVEIDKDAMGRLAAKRLISRIRSPEDAFQHSVVNQINTSLVVRQSCRSI